MTLIQYKPPTYEGYEYPAFARALGLLLAVIPLIPLPVLMVIQLVNTQGSFIEVSNVNFENNYSPTLKKITLVHLSFTLL